jgi:two-component system cell cycle response regulator
MNMLSKTVDIDDISFINRRLRAKLNNLISEARINEHTLRKYQLLELKLLGCLTITDLLEALCRESREQFGWPMVTLVLQDPDYVIRNLLSEVDINLTQYPELIFTNDLQHLNRLSKSTRLPLLGAYARDRHEMLFLETQPPLSSVAILPLERAGKLLGSVNLGSPNRNRFKTGTATDFLQHLAAVIGACLDNVISHEQLKHVGLTDALTRVNNRRAFDQRLAEKISRALLAREPLSCLFIDVDHFRQINDIYGHEGGDFVLKNVARLVKGELRSMDVVARYGGEEFVALLTKADNHQATEIGARIRCRVAEDDFRLENREPLNVTVSIGVATLPSCECPQENPSVLGQQLVTLADKAHCQAKKAGRNWVIAGNEYVIQPTRQRSAKILSLLDKRP